MTEPTLTHVHGDRITAAVGGTEILAYVYRAEDPWEAPKPYLHPIRTLAGALVTDYRPNDHRWHKGLQLTASHLSGQNLWGGACYVHGQGYVRIPERVGSMRHEGFDEVAVRDGSAVITERLSWRNHGGEHWADELRRIEVGAVDTAAGSYALTWTSEITNRRGEPLLFGSPTTAGREMAGYTGLFWRGPRGWSGGTVLGPGGGGPEMMGRQSPWLAYTAEHDGVDGRATLVFEHAPSNDHEGAAGQHPAHWFVRNTPFPAVAPSWAFFEEMELPDGETLSRGYRVVVADGAWDEAAVAKWQAEHPW